MKVLPGERFRRRAVLVAIVLLAAAVRLWGAARLPLSGDEAYHWEWSRHLAGAYYDHPGMTAWLIALSVWLLPGGGELAVRLPAMLCLLASTVLAFGMARTFARWRGAEERIAERAGTIAGALVFFVPLPAALSVYMSTDPPLLPLWLAAAWAFAAAIERGRTRSWVVCGAAVGLAASTKLIALQLLGAVGLFLVATRTGRQWLRRPQPWLAMAVAILAAAPMLLWNLTNDWMTFRFNFDIRQREQVASVWHPVTFVASQAAILTPGIFVLALAACLARSVRARPAELAASLCALLPLALFLAVSVRRRVGVHWAAAPWLCALVVLATLLAVREPWTQRPWARMAWRSSWVLAIAVLLVASLFAWNPDRIARLELAGGQPRRVLRNLFGWEEVGRAVAAAAADLGARPAAAGVFVMSNQYGVAAAVAFYTPGRPPVHLWSEVRNHGRSYAEWDDWGALRGRDAVYVTKREIPEWDVDRLRQHFAEVSPIESVVIGADDDQRNAFFIVRCRGFDGRQPFLPR